MHHLSLVSRKQLMRMIECARVACVVFSLVVSELAFGSIAGSGTTKEEMALLPPYCPYAPLYVGLFGEREGVSLWKARIGPEFDHIHHYCWALVAIQRVHRRTTSPQERVSLLRGAVGDISYVIVRSRPQFFLLPELHLRLGQAYALSGQSAAAVEAYREAIRVRRDYSPPYVELARLAQKEGKSAQARQILEEGLKHAPDSKYLLHALSEIIAGNERP